jgi:hypothetical protein
MILFVGCRTRAGIDVLCWLHAKIYMSLMMSTPPVRQYRVDLGLKLRLALYW